MTNYFLETGGVANTVLQAVVCALTLASLIAVIRGWRVTRRDTLRAQKIQFYDEMIMQAAREISDDLLKYIRWLLTHSNTLDRLARTGGADAAARATVKLDGVDPMANQWMLTTRAHEYALRHQVPYLSSRATRLMAVHVASIKRIDHVIEATDMNVAQKQVALIRLSRELVTRSHRIFALRHDVVRRVQDAVFDPSDMFDSEKQKRPPAKRTKKWWPRRESNARQTV